MKLTTKQIAMTAVMLAVCIVSQFFKNTSVFITGPIINAASFFITGSPIMAAVPAMFPCIMAGNIVLVLLVYFLKDRFGKAGLPVSMVCGSVLKGVFMGLVIALIVLPTFLPEQMAPKLPALQMQFSVVQGVTALIGSLYAFIIIQALNKAKVMD